MRELVILTEEPSAVPVFERLSQFLDPETVCVTIVPHNGWSALEKSLPRKLRGWTNPNSRFLIVRDNDGGDCSQHKERITEVVRNAGREDVTMVRIVCQELEAWFLGDREAMHNAGVLSQDDKTGKFSGDPDQINAPSKLLADHLNGYPKGASARAISPFLDPENNKSVSFANTFNAMQTLAKEE